VAARKEPIMRFQQLVVLVSLLGNSELTRIQ
jgi:hypothetical protein